MFSGLKYMLKSSFKFVSHSATDGARLFKDDETDNQETPAIDVDNKTIRKNMLVAKVLFGVAFLLCVLGVVFYTENSTIAGGHFLLLAVFFGFKFLQVSKDLMAFTEGSAHGRTEKRQ
jgi:hypothetical protein